VGFQDETCGLGSASPTCMPGLRRARRCDWWSRPCRKAIPIPKPWLATFVGLLSGGSRHLVRAGVAAFCGGAPDQCGPQLSSLLGAAEAGEDRKRALLMIWDNASWHISKFVHHWIQQHNREVRQSAGACASCPATCRPRVHGSTGLSLIGCTADVMSLKPTRLLTAQELADRVCQNFGCTHESHLAVTENVT